MLPPTVESPAARALSVRAELSRLVALVADLAPHVKPHGIAGYAELVAAVASLDLAVARSEQASLAGGIHGGQRWVAK